MPTDKKREKQIRFWEEKKPHIFKRNGDFSTPHLFFPDLIILVFFCQKEEWPQLETLDLCLPEN